MAFEELNENLEWEARRIATAFQIPDSEIRIDSSIPAIYFEGSLTLEVQASYNVIDLLQIGLKQGYYCEVWRNDDTNDWCVTGEPQEMCDLMARALYRLGFEDEEVFAELNYSFTDQEKIELRDSMPRKFWPKNWLDEEGT